MLLPDVIRYRRFPSRQSKSVLRIKHQILPWRRRAVRNDADNPPAGLSGHLIGALPIR